MSRSRLQKVSHSLIVNFDEAGLHGILPALLLQAFGSLNDLLNGPRDDSLGVSLASKHSVGLSTSSLAIAKEADLVTVKGTLHKLGDFTENIRLAALISEHLVESKLPVLGLRVERAIVGTWRSQLHGDIVHISNRCLGELLLQGSDPAKHSDVTAELLNLVMELSPDVLGLQKLSLHLRDSALPVLDLKLQRFDVILKAEDLLPALLHGLGRIADLLHLLLLVLGLGFLQSGHLGVKNFKLVQELLPVLANIVQTSCELVNLENMVLGHLCRLLLEGGNLLLLRLQGSKSTLEAHIHLVKLSSVLCSGFLKLLNLLVQDADGAVEEFLFQRLKGRLLVLLRLRLKLGLEFSKGLLLAFIEFQHQSIFLALQGSLMGRRHLSGKLLHLAFHVSGEHLVQFDLKLFEGSVLLRLEVTLKPGLQALNLSAVICLGFSSELILSELQGLLQQKLLLLAKLLQLVLIQSL
mmetsp:Transcript_548/g.1563  ORF Transcript_548/g.1563 Transcript_548/m.1563 type:complete len:466 (-) Transcript_548:1300-2697(-)